MYQAQKLGLEQSESGSRIRTVVSLRERYHTIPKLRLFLVHKIWSDARNPVHTISYFLYKNKYKKQRFRVKSLVSKAFIPESYL